MRGGRCWQVPLASLQLLLPWPSKAPDCLLPPLAHQQLPGTCTAGHTHTRDPPPRSDASRGACGLAQAAAQGLAQYPRQLRLDLLPGGGVAAGPAGMLHVRLLRLCDLASTGYFRRPAPYVVLQVASAGGLGGAVRASPARWQAAGDGPQLAAGPGVDEVAAPWLARLLAALWRAGLQLRLSAEVLFTHRFRQLPAARRRLNCPELASEARRVSLDSSFTPSPTHQHACQGKLAQQLAAPQLFGHWLSM
jgi:hypothetical protein